MPGSYLLPNELHYNGLMTDLGKSRKGLCFSALPLVYGSISPKEGKNREKVTFYFVNR